MPKEIVSAEQVLDQTAAGAEPVETASPVVETPVTPVEPSPPEPGFEDPPESATEEPAAPTPSAAELLAEEPAVPAPSAAELLAEQPAAEPKAQPPVLGSVRSDMESVASNNGAIDTSKLGGDQGQANEPKEEPAPEPVAPAWRFVKNIHPGEKILFKDGSEYQLKQGVNVIFDAELAAKILAVAGVYNIVQQ